MMLDIVDERSCKRCGHVWFPRKPEPPVQCPDCHSPYWDIPRGTTRIARSAVKSIPKGVDRVDLYLNQTHVGSISVPEVEMCPVSAFDGETGETYRCGLPKHGANVKHTKGERI